MKASIALVLAHVVAHVAGFSMPLDPADPTVASLIGYGFTHVGWLHLAANMLALLSLGLGVEREAGPASLWAVHLAGVAVAGAAHLALGAATPVVGASGGVAAVLVAYAALNPDKVLWFVVLPLRAPLMVLALACLGVACVAFGWFPRIAHIAHLGGMFAGCVWSALWFINCKEKANV